MFDLLGFRLNRVTVNTVADRAVSSCLNVTLQKGTLPLLPLLPARFTFTLSGCCSAERLSYLCR